MNALKQVIDVIDFVNAYFSTSFSKVTLFPFFFRFTCSFCNWPWYGRIKLISFHYLKYWFYVLVGFFCLSIAWILLLVVVIFRWSVIKSLFQPYCFIGLLAVMIDHTTQLYFNHFGIQFEARDFDLKKLNLNFSTN